MKRNEQIRNLTLDDVKQINDIRNYYIENTDFIFRNEKKSFEEDLKYFEEILDKGYPAIVLADGDNILGFANLSPFRSTDGYDKTAELSIYLKDDIHNTGFGTLLLEEIEKLAINKYHLILSVISSTNTKSISFHEKNEYSVAGVLKESGFINNKYIDVTIMQKFI